MQEFRFTSDLRTGIQAIDRQHVEWFQALEALRKAVAAGGGETGAAKALAFVVSYTRRHFADEEAAMRESAYPDLAEHRKLHDALVARINGITAAHGEGGEAAVQVLDLMAAWIREHIATADQAYVPTLRKQG